jgi:hypothetical protein
MRRVHPPGPQGNRAVIEPGDTELLEPLDPSNDIHQGVYRTYLVEWNPVGGQAVDPSLRLAQQLERLHRPLLHPGRQLRPLDNRDQLTYMPVRPVAGRMWMILVLTAMEIMVVVGSRDLGRLFVSSVRQQYGDLGGPHPAAVYRSNVDCDVRKPEAGRDAPEPLWRRAGSQQGAEQHVAADAGNRVQNGKASIGHRLRNIPPYRPSFKCWRIRSASRAEKPGTAASSVADADLTPARLPNRSSSRRRLVGPTPGMLSSSDVMVR